MAKKDLKDKVSIGTASPEAAAKEFFGSALEEKGREVKETSQQSSGEARSGSAGVEKQRDDRWLNENYEGQLTVDVFQTEDSMVIQSTVAGVRVGDLDISVNNDMVTIRGIRRREQNVLAENYFYQECYWGGFSRSIILPFDVKSEKANATLKNGILTVVLPKAEKPRSRSVRVREELDDTES